MIGMMMLTGEYFQAGFTNKKTCISDMSLYPPSNNEPASFIAEPLIIDGEAELVVAFQLSLKKINALMQTPTSLAIRS